jgi:hypothetical protein
VLTHFSQRYPRLPGGIDATAHPWRRRPLLAFDGWVLPFNLLPAAPLLTPVVALALGAPSEDGAGTISPGVEAAGGADAE